MRPTLFIKSLVNKIVRSNILCLFVDMPHSEWFERGSQKSSQKKIILLKRCQMESAVRETVASLLSLSFLLDRSKQFIRRSLLLDRFT